ncbi:E3 ubiquitin-protein ligase RKP isoform X1 [Phoenix dactylifera]|uniref:E3 ubiquitin-protein ligase RKP isoform X1 n=1 Tax=Phoenix dactylifera TaxID=42345 RepID=A0A8B7D070_PHODC|nr:E3 ubiquitin-protein ligase RKP isoform X1 [Phoenix dactylifera]
MAEDSLRHNGFLSGLAVLLSDDDPRGVSQNSHLISYCDDIGNQSVERTLEHIFDLPYKSICPSGTSIDVEFIRSILRNQLPRFQLDPAVDSRNRDGMSIAKHGSGPDVVVIDDASICGDIKIIRKPLLIESLAEFSSARANSCVWKGKWMYEVTLETSGVQQLGWATILCPFTDRKGVGDAEDSYAFDGKRVSKWNKEPKSYGQSWVVGDVIGCCIDLDADMISFYRNGESLGVAFDGVRKMERGLGYYPAISLSKGECCDLNFGARPFKYPIDGFLPIQAPPSSRYFATYLLQCLCRLFEVQCLDKSESAYFEKFRRLKRFAPLKELFSSISRGICEEFFNLIKESEECAEYMAWDAFVSFLLEVFGAQEPHDYASLDQIIDLFLEFSGSSSLFQHVIVALSCSCKVAPIVLMECPYSGSYPYLALACHILRREDMMVLLWKSPDFGFSLEGFLSRKSPNKQDLHSLIPSVWWPGSSEDIGSESSMMMTMTALSAAVNKIEEMQQEVCSLVIHFIPPVSPPQLPGSVFRTFLQNLILKVRGADHKNPPSGVSSNSILVSLYTVILHFLSEGFSMEDFPGSMKGSRMNAGTDGGFLHRGGKRSFPVDLFLKADPNCIRTPRIGGSVNHVLKSYQVNGLETEKVFWDEGCMDDEDTRITHSTRQKPCCCSISDVDVVQTSKDNIRYATKSSKGTCSPIPERSAHVAAECSVRSLSDEIADKPSSSDQSETDFGYQSLQHLESVPMTNQLSSGTLREEELLDIMLLLYHLAVAPNFRQAFYYMTHQSQSISLLDDTDKQIRERSCIEQVKRLKEARNVYREELVDCVRQCAWYRISLFSRWKQRGMYATCMWIVELLLVLSNTDSIFLYVPEYYVESVVDCFHALRRSDPPFVSSAIFIKQGLAPFITFVVKHFNDPRISSADIKDLLLQSISVLVQYKDYLIAFENNKEAVRRMPRALLLAFDNRSWIPVTNILVKLCKGSGFGSSKHAETSSSALFQVLLREACVHDEVLFSSFLNRLFNTLSWSMTEFSVSIREMQESYQIGDLQQRKCGVVFDLSCSLARILEFCTREIPQAFILGPDMNLRRLTELVIFILNHIILGVDAELFDLLLRRPSQHQEKSSRTMILAPLVGIILNLMDASADSGNQELNDVVAVFANMDCPATVRFGFQYLLSYDWSNILQGDASLAKLAQLEEFLNYLRSRTEALDGIGELGISTDDEGENQCCICYASDCDAFFGPCHHRSCLGCITRHLLNSQRCFFCNAKVTAVMRVDLKGCKLAKLG